MEAWWVTLLRTQQSDGFPDLAGTEVSATIPISDRLLTHAIAARIPPTAPIREFALFAHPDNQFTLRVRVTTPSFLPPAQVRLAVDQQPRLPTTPVLVLAVVSRGIASLALKTLNFVDLLPSGVRFEAGRFFIDLRTVLSRWNADEALTYLTDLTVTTTEGRVVVQARAALPAQE